MTLEEILKTVRCVEAPTAFGSIQIEAATMLGRDDYQSYWYDIHQGRKRLHSELYGVFGPLSFACERLEEDLDVMGLAVDLEALDWQPMSQALDFSDCLCADCKSLLLEHGVMPRGLPWYEHLWYRLRFLAHDLQWRCWLHPRFVVSWWYDQELKPWLADVRHALHLVVVYDLPLRDVPDVVARCQAERDELQPASIHDPLDDE